MDTRCHAVTNAGERCSRGHGKDSIYCGSHSHFDTLGVTMEWDPQIEAKRAEAKAAWAKEDRLHYQERALAEHQGGHPYTNWCCPICYPERAESA